MSIVGDTRLYRFGDTAARIVTPQDAMPCLCGTHRLWSGATRVHPATSHKGMGISRGDRDRLLGHVRATLDKFKIPEAERRDVLAFVESTRAKIVER